MMTVYSKIGCAYCKLAVNLLDKHMVKYKEIKVGTDITREEFISSYPDVKSVPFILEGDKVIGGYDQLVKSLHE